MIPHSRDGGHVVGKGAGTGSAIRRATAAPRQTK